MILNQELYTDKYFVIVNTLTGERITIKPVAIEKCMEPGQFNITPVEVIKTDKACIYQSGNLTAEVDEGQRISGEIRVEEYAFVPQVKRMKTLCTPCRNCGRC